MASPPLDDEFTSWDRYPELTALQHFRLERNLSYRALGDQIGIPFRTLHNLLNSSAAHPHDRTLYRIRRFLRQARATKPTPRRRRGAVA